MAHEYLKAVHFLKCLAFQENSRLLWLVLQQSNRCCLGQSRAETTPNLLLDQRYQRALVGEIRARQRLVQTVAQLQDSLPRLHGHLPCAEIGPRDGEPDLELVVIDEGEGRKGGRRRRQEEQGSSASIGL